jgi:hypothetical protein
MELKLVEKSGLSWVEIRHYVHTSNIQIFVSKGGWIYKNEYAQSEDGSKSNEPFKVYAQNVGEYNIRWSQNGSAYMTFKDFEEITSAIEKAKKMLDIN